MLLPLNVLELSKRALSALKVTANRHNLDIFLYLYSRLTH